MTYAFWNKTNVVVFLSFTSIIVPFTFDSVIAVSSIIGSSYENSSHFGNALISGIYGVGLGCGSLLLGPLFDIRGRREMFIMGMLIVCISAILSCFATTISQLLATRFFQGLGVASQILAYRCIIGDYFDDENESSAAYSVVFMVSFVSAIVSPILSGIMVGSELFVIAGSPWKIIFIQIAVIAFIIIVILFSFPETAPLAENKKSYISYIINYLDNFKNKEFMMYSILNSVFAAFLYTYFLSISFIMQDLIKIDLYTYTMMLSVNMVFGAIGSFINSKCLEKFNLSLMITAGCNILVLSSIIFLLVSLDFDVISDIGNYTKAYMLNFSFLLIIFSYGIACPNLIVKIISAVDPKVKGNAISALGIMQLSIGMLLCNLIGYFATTYLSVMSISIGLLVMSLWAVTLDLYCKRLFEK